MGWWYAEKPGGGIDFDRSSKKADARGSNLINAFDDDGPIGGDGPADIMDRAIDDIRMAFRGTWDRDPTLEELDLAWQFSTGFWRKEGRPYHAEPFSMKRARKVARGKKAAKTRKANKAKIEAETKAREAGE
ncbi:MAG: hypothetical protein HN929_12560 [Chloroflexi bacterium]|jgi:hypothetical protein|nr:hypothetical protein [Chloroflexota bacterium]